LLTAVPDVSGEIFRGWCPAVVPLLHAGRDTTEADTHRRFLRGCIFGPGCKSRRLHYLTSLGGAPCHSPHPCAWRAVAHRAKAGARGRLRRLTLQPSLTLDSTRVSFGWQAGPRLRPQALPHSPRTSCRSDASDELGNSVQTDELSIGTISVPLDVLRPKRSSLSLPVSIFAQRTPSVSSAQACQHRSAHAPGNEMQ
jgi:hypothetical protein